MKAFNNEPLPVAKPGQILRLEPEETLREVEALEQLGVLGPFDYGSITAGGTATQDNSNNIEITEIEMRQNQIAQVWVIPVSPVEIEVAQDGQQDFRFETANQRGVIEQGLPPQQRELFVPGDNVPYFIISNPNTYDLQKSQVAFMGFKYELTDQPLQEEPVDQQPISIPVERLERSTQGGGTSGTQSRAQGASMSQGRASRRGQ